MSVPFTRGLSKGSKGADVLAVERALEKLHYLPPKSADRVYGPGTSAAVLKFQRDKKLKPATGDYGPRTHAALVRAGGFDAVGAATMTKVHQALTKHGGRADMRQAAMIMFRYTSNIHYTQTARRMQIVRTGLNTPAKLEAQCRKSLYEDCSSSTTGIYYIGRMPDPNGLGYNGQGYTGTQINHGRRSATAPFGALIFYTNSSGVVSHVTMSMGDGTCFSHGNEAAPQRLPNNYRRIHSIRVYW